MSEYPFTNPSLPENDRLANLLSLMTLDEKIKCLSTDPSVPRLGIRGSDHVEGLHGLSQGGPANWAPKRPLPTTTFPQSYGLGQTWNPELLFKIGRAEGIECRYIWQNEGYRQGGIVVRAPNADLGRDPRWGRTEECYGEDPFLTGTLVVAMVKGLQGDDPKCWLTASLMKHFLANSNENSRDFSSSDFDERLWREYYSVPFRMGVIEGGSRAYMAAYNAWNGVPCHINPMHRDITVKEWGQDGIICTDGGGYMLLRKAHKAAKTQAEAATKIIKAGIGQFLDNYKRGVKDALKKGMLTEADIDSVLTTVFRVMLRLGLLDLNQESPYASIGEGPEPWTTQENIDLVRQATRESIVLLKNEGCLLPLEKGKLKSIAVLGKRADKVYLDWYSGTPPYAVTPLEGTRSALEGATVLTAKDEKESLEIAKKADIVIFVCGNDPVGTKGGWATIDHPSEGREAIDRETIDLPEEELIRKVFKANPRTILVLNASFPYAINWSQENLPAIIQMAHNSQEQGNALADVLFGQYNPGGRLTQTWPKSLDDVPEMMDYNIRNGRTYMYFKGEPLYPFGFGLSYTEFSYRALKATDGGQTYKLKIEVENTGGCDGEEVVQVYARFADSAVERPQKQLCAFKRVSIKKGETKAIEFEVKKETLAYWSVETHGWVIEEKPVEFLVGPSSSGVALKTVC